MKFVALLLLVFIFLLILIPKALAAATSVDLLTANSFAVLAGSGITNTGTTTIVGDVGSYPTTTQNGFGSVTITGTNHIGDTTTQGAKTDLVTAYNDAAGQTPTGTISADLGGQTLTSGVYRDNDAPDSLAITGTLTLDAEGDPNAVFIFQSGSTLTTATGSIVSLINGAQACNVFWQIGSSAILGTTSTFAGNILAMDSITDNGGSVIDGRFLARNATVVLNNTNIETATCDLATPTPTPTTAPTSTPTTSSVLGLTSNSTSSDSSCPALNYITPLITESRRIDEDSIFISWGPYSGINTFNVRYGTTNGNWLYNTNVTGFSTTINNLGSNQPIWVQVAVRNDCAIGSYGEQKFVGKIILNTNSPGFPNTGNPRLPDTGFDPN